MILARLYTEGKIFFIRLCDLSHKKRDSIILAIFKHAFPKTYNCIQPMFKIKAADDLSTKRYSFLQKILVFRSQHA